MARPQSPPHQSHVTGRLHPLPAPSRPQKMLLGLSAVLLAAWIAFLVTLTQLA